MADFSKYTNYANNAGISGVVFGASSTVLEVELNEMQEIQAHYMREFFKSVIGDGITDLSKLTYSDGKIKIADGCNIMCNGYLIKANGLELAITGGTAYLWIWEDEVDYNATLHVEGNINNTNNIKNWIKDDRADNETTKRKVVRYQLTNIIPSDPKYSYLPIAKIIGSSMVVLVNEVNPNKADYTDDDIYGVEVDFSSNKFTRLAGAIGKNGGTDFDNIVPWNRRRCNITTDGAVIAYYGDAGYTEDGKLTQAIAVNGTTYPIGTRVNVMVEQKKFYYKMIPLSLEPITDGIGYKVRKARYYISATPKDGFKLYPAFIRNGIKKDVIYDSAFKACLYDTSANGYKYNDNAVADMPTDSLGSIAGAKPISGITNRLTRAMCRTLASNMSSGWQQEDFLLNNATIMLFMIEYAVLDMQKVVGRGRCDITDNGNESLSINTGGTSYLGNSTGMANGIDGQVSISYRGKEDLFGNIWSFVDGANIKTGENILYYADHGFTDDINTEPYKSTAFTLAKTSGYITAFGWSEDCDFLFLPAETTLVNSNTTMSDYVTVNPSYDGGWLAILYGGDWNYKSDCGLCCWGLSTASASYYHTIGARLAYIPVN